MALSRVGILTGGGDCSRLNAVTRAITCTAIIQHNSKVVGIEDGFDGLIFDRILGTRFGAFAVKAALEGQFGNMVALRTPNLILTPLKYLAGSA